MATPNEQHGARGTRARVVGSGHLDGREPLVEAPGGGERRDAGGVTGSSPASDALQRGLDAASSEPRDADEPVREPREAHAAPRDLPAPDNTDTEARG